MKITLSNGLALDVNVVHDQNPYTMGRHNYRATSVAAISQILNVPTSINNTAVREETVIGTGVARCRMEDNFSRHVGSAFAVARALANSPLGGTARDNPTNRRLRTEFWAKFWNGKYNISNQKRSTNREVRREKAKL